MNKRDMLYRFIKRIERSKLLTLFIQNIFDYDNLYDYNYIFRINKEGDNLVIDIYDNVSVNRFNRYIFNYDNKIINNDNLCDNNVFITYINVNDVKDSNNKLYKLAYLFKLDNDNMIAHANTFLDQKIVDILKSIIKK